MRWLMAASVIGIVGAVWLFFKPDITEGSKDNIVVTPNSVDEPNNINTPLLTDSLSDTVFHKSPQIKDNMKDIAVVDNAKYEDLLVASYEAPAFAKMRSDGDTNVDIIYLDSIKTLMQKKDFKKALIVVENRRFSNDYQIEIATLKAHIYMELHQYRQAEMLFQQIASAGIAPYSEENEYYLLLSYLADFKNNQLNLML